MESKNIIRTHSEIESEQRQTIQTKGNCCESTGQLHSSHSLGSCMLLHYITLKINCQDEPHKPTKLQASLAHRIILILQHFANDAL